MRKYIENLRNVYSAEKNSLSFSCFLGENACENRCEEMGREARLRAEREAAVQREGFAIKQNLIRCDLLGEFQMYLKH